MTAGRGTVGAGIAACAAGGALAVAAFLQPEKMNAPAWVVYAAALAFILAGALVVARARGYARLQAWLPVALLACLVAPPLWIGFGSGSRRCSIALLGNAVRLLGVRSDLPCRIGFGFAAVVGIGLLALAIRQAVRSAGDRPR
jgi:hypothetical protein